MQKACWAQSRQVVGQPVLPGRTAPAPPLVPHTPTPGPGCTHLGGGGQRRGRPERRAAAAP